MDKFFLTNAYLYCNFLMAIIIRDIAAYWKPDVVTTILGHVGELQVDLVPAGTGQPSRNGSARLPRKKCPARQPGKLDPARQSSQQGMARLEVQLPSQQSVNSQWAWVIRFAGVTRIRRKHSIYP
jgi:hypothetical protein